MEQKISTEIKLSESIDKELPQNINNKSDTKSKIKLFNSLFKGRTDVYAKRWENEITAVVARKFGTALSNFSRNSSFGNFQGGRKKNVNNLF